VRRVISDQGASEIDEVEEAEEVKEKRGNAEDCTEVTESAEFTERKNPRPRHPPAAGLGQPAEEFSVLSYRF